MTELTEATCRPWEVEAGDVIVRDPIHPEITGRWTVTGKPWGDGWFTHVTVSLPNGGEHVFTLEPGNQLSIAVAKEAV